MAAPTVEIVWTQRTEQYANGEHGQVGAWTCFGINWSAVRKEDDKPWSLTCRLPGIKEHIGAFKTPEEAKDRAQKVLAHWLSKLLP